MEKLAHFSILATKRQYKTNIYSKHFFTIFITIFIFFIAVGSVREPPWGAEPRFESGLPYSKPVLCPFFF
jgi:hypothetical protein